MARTATATKKRKPATNKTIPKKSKKPSAANKKSAVKNTAIKVIVSAMTAKTGQKLDESAVLPDVGLDFCGETIKGRQHTFLLYYMTPGQPCFHNAKQAAIRAGYTQNTASVTVYRMLRNPVIQKIISANTALGYQSLHEAAKVAIEIKKQRSQYKPSDFFRRKEVKIVTKKGEYTKEILDLKPLEEMTDLQQMCIDGIEIKGQASIPVYMLPDRGKELNEIIKLDAEYSKSIADTGEEETREIIMERITIRETKRAQRPAGWEQKIIEDPIEVTEEDDDDV
ncbi:MAG: terminase small subunit [Treponema sp.]|jgi:hypothetical protein|nr:terminase small subunit [Treponema sp.]